MCVGGNLKRARNDVVGEQWMDKRRGVRRGGRSLITSQPWWVYRYRRWLGGVQHDGGQTEEEEGWMRRWRDGWRGEKGKCLSGSTWQLSERGSRVATLCNLLAGPWCMQAWHHAKPGKHSLEWERQTAGRKDRGTFWQTGAHQGKDQVHTERGDKDPDPTPPCQPPSASRDRPASIPPVISTWQRKFSITASASCTPS